MLEASTVDGPERSSDGRLDSWKAIASYLGRDVSTVRRWEKTEGLPVHRHRHAARGSAYAYKSELDRWFQSRRATLEPAPADHAAPTGGEAGRDDSAAPDTPSGAIAGPAGRRKWHVWMAAAAMLMLTTALAVSTRGRPRAAPSPSFQARDWILLAAFDNRTGVSALDDTLQYALERDLSESDFVNIVSRERVDDTLRLMKRAIGTRVDRATGLEVCMRDGGIRALLIGRVERLGGAYVISALVVDSKALGQTMAAADVRAADEEHILDAIHQLSAQIRQALGEKLRPIQNTSLKLERVTTGSLAALRFYTQGVRALNGRDWRVASEFLQRAIGEDPDFASAQVYLAWCLANLHRPPAEYVPHARAAAMLAEHQSDREQYFILASYEHMMGDLNKAAALYETLLALHPDHFWGANNLYALYDRLDRRSEQWPLMARLFKARPNDFVTTVHAIQAGLAAGIPLDQVDAMAAHARELTPDISIEAAWEPVFLDLLPAVLAWCRDDVPATIRLAEQMAARSPEHAKTAALLELSVGRLAAAEKLIIANAGPHDREADLALLAFFRGDRQVLASHLAAARQNYGRQLPLVVWLSAQAPPLQDTVRFLREWSARPDDGHSPMADSAWAASVKAEFRLRHAVDRAAITDLENAVRAEDQTRARYVRGAAAVADWWATQGDLEKSAALLEEATRPKTRVFTGPTRGESFIGVFWLRARAKLARVYRQMGRANEADRVDAEVARLLSTADPDFILLR